MEHSVQCTSAKPWGCDTSARIRSANSNVDLPVRSECIPAARRDTTVGQNAPSTVPRLQLRTRLILDVSSPRVFEAIAMFGLLKNRRREPSAATRSDQVGFDVSALAPGDWVVVCGKGPGDVVGRETRQVDGRAVDCVVLDPAGMQRLSLSTEQRHQIVRRPMDREMAQALLKELAAPLPAIDGRSWEDRYTAFEQAAVSNDASRMAPILRELWARPKPRSFGERKASDTLEQILLQEVARVLEVSFKKLCDDIPGRVPPTA